MWSGRSPRSLAAPVQPNQHRRMLHSHRPPPWPQTPQVGPLRATALRLFREAENAFFAPYLWRQPGQITEIAPEFWRRRGWIVSRFWTPVAPRSKVAKALWGFCDATCSGGPGAAGTRAAIVTEFATVVVPPAADCRRNFATIPTRSIVAQAPTNPVFARHCRCSCKSGRFVRRCRGTVATLQARRGGRCLGLAAARRRNAGLAGAQGRTRTDTPRGGGF